MYGERAVMTGVGCSGHLHLGHAAALFIYKYFRRSARFGRIYVSDVGAFFSRNLTWETVGKFRDSIKSTLHDFGISSDDVRFESESLSEILNKMGEEPSTYNFDDSLTVAEIALTIRESSNLLLVLGRDEEYFVGDLTKRIGSPDALSWITYETILSPQGNAKMSKSKRETCVALDNLEESIGEMSPEYMRYCESYFHTLLMELGIDTTKVPRGLYQCIEWVKFFGSNKPPPSVSTKSDDELHKYQAP